MQMVADLADRMHVRQPSGKGALRRYAEPGEVDELCRLVGTAPMAAHGATAISPFAECG